MHVPNLLLNCAAFHTPAIQKGARMWSRRLSVRLRYELRHTRQDPGLQASFQPRVSHYGFILRWCTGVARRGRARQRGETPKSPTLRRWVNLRSISRDFRFLLLLEGGPTGFSFSFLNWFYCVLGNASSSPSSWTPVELPFWAGSFFTLPADVVM